MKIPKSVSVLGKTYTVKHKTPPGRRKHYGSCESRHTTLYVSPKQSKCNKSDTLLHEILHAVSEEMQLGLKEHQVRLGATALYAVLRDNPTLVAYLMVD